jgi:hypothetical protein
MTRYTPRRVAAVPRRFVAALLVGAAAITAVSAAQPSPAAQTEWRIAR